MSAQNREGPEGSRQDQGYVSVVIIRIKASVLEDHEKPAEVLFSKTPGSCICSGRRRCSHNFGAPSQGSSPLRSGSFGLALRGLGGERCCVIYRGPCEGPVRLQTGLRGIQIDLTQWGPRPVLPKRREGIPLSLQRITWIKSLVKTSSQTQW